MRADDHGDVVARANGVEARVLRGRQDVDTAVEVLDRAENAAGVPLVDESERARLTALADGEWTRPDHWHSVLARSTDGALGYAGLVLPSEPGGLAVGDVAVPPAQRPVPGVLPVLLGSLAGLAEHHAAGRLSVWIRHASGHDVATAADAGFAVERRLGVLGRHLDDDPADLRPAPPPGTTIRPFHPADADAVVAVLRAAYAGTPDGDWTRAEFDRRRGYDWYRDDDLLVAEVDGDLRGVHWTKQRGSGVGEVYNLAVRPEAQGSGLGAHLLLAGLAHLADLGCHEVLLWVDLANERGVRLYTSHGFHVRWEDLALGRELRHST